MSEMLFVAALIIIMVAQVIGVCWGLLAWHSLDPDSYHKFYPVNGETAGVPFAGPCMWCKL